MQTPLSYIVCSLERTGSYLLCDALACTGIAGQPKECFHPVCLAQLAKRRDPSGRAAFFAQIIREGTTSNGVFGAKVHWSHLKGLVQTLRQAPEYDSIAALDALQQVFPNLHYIRLTRRDKVRQAISLLKARQTDVWWKMDAWARANRTAVASPPTSDLDALDRLIPTLISQEAAWQRFFDGAGIRPLDIVYEDFVGSYEPTIRSVLDYLQIPIPLHLSIASPRYQKQADEHTELWAQQYLTLRATHADDDQDAPRGSVHREDLDIIRPHQQTNSVPLRAPVGVSTQEPTRPLRIVSYATRPLGGLPVLLVHCINTRTPHTACCVWGGKGLPPARVIVAAGGDASLATASGEAVGTAAGAGVAGDTATEDERGGVSGHAQVREQAHEWISAPEAVAAALAAADVVLIHDGLVAPQHHALLADKAVLTLAHHPQTLTSPWIRHGVSAILRPQLASLPTFRSWPVLPLPLPWWEPALRPWWEVSQPDVSARAAEEPIRRLTIAFMPLPPLPFARSESRHRPDRLLPGSICAPAVEAEALADASPGASIPPILRTLGLLAAEWGAELWVGLPAPRDATGTWSTGNLAGMDTAAGLARVPPAPQVLVEGCASQSYHYGTLVGLSRGCAVVSGLGIDPLQTLPFLLGAGIAQSAQKDAEPNPLPVYTASADQLDAVLRTVLADGIDGVRDRGHAGRAWLEQHWDFTRQWDQVWMPLIRRALPPPAPLGRVVHRTLPSTEGTASPSDAITGALGTRKTAAGMAKEAHVPSIYAPSPPAGRVISVVVVSHNEGEYLHRTVQGVLASLPTGSEIIVIDDCSTDGSSDSLPCLDERVRVLRTPQQQGVAKARNYGARYARGEIIVFSDAHVTVPHDWISPLAEVLDQRDIGAVAPAVSTMNSLKPARGFGGFVQESDLEWRWLGWQGPQPHTVPLLCGCFLMVRRDIFEATDGFDSGMIMYGVEDTEFCLRLWTLGYRCIVVPSVEVKHLFRNRHQPLPNYQRDWEPIIHNMLRLGVVHYGRERLQKLIAAKVNNAAFAAAWSRVVTSDVWERRQAVRSARVHDDDWFFRTFAQREGGSALPSVEK